MILWSMHECMHAISLFSAFSFFCQPKLLLGLFAIRMILSQFCCALTKAVQSPIAFVKSGKSIKEIPVAHEGLACCLDAILL